MSFPGKIRVGQTPLKCSPAGQRNKTERKGVMIKAWPAAVRVEKLETWRWNISHLVETEMDREDRGGRGWRRQLAWWWRAL